MLLSWWHPSATLPGPQNKGQVPWPTSQGPLWNTCCPSLLAQLPSSHTANRTFLFLANTILPLCQEFFCLSFWPGHLGHTPRQTLGLGSSDLCCKKPSREFWCSSLRNIGLIQSSGTMLDFCIWSASLYQVPHGPNSSACCRWERPRLSSWLPWVPAANGVVIDENFSHHIPFLEKLNQFQIVTFFYWQRRNFSTCLIYFSSTFHPSRSCQAEPCWAWESNYRSSTSSGKCCKFHVAPLRHAIYCLEKYFFSPLLLPSTPPVWFRKLWRSQ